MEEKSENTLTEPFDGALLADAVLLDLFLFFPLVDRVICITWICSFRPNGERSKHL